MIDDSLYLTLYFIYKSFITINNTNLIHKGCRDYPDQWINK